MSAYIPVLFPFPTVGKANKRILQCKQTLKWHLGEKSPKKLFILCKPEAGYRKTGD